ELARYIAGNVGLQADKVSLFAIVSVAPDYVLSLCVDQFEAQRQSITSLDNPPVQNRLHVQLLTDSFRISRFTFVTKHRRPRFHVKIRQLRQTADESFGHSVREIF